MTEALIGFIAIFALALLRVPLAFAMGLVGIVGMGLTRGWGAHPGQRGAGGARHRLCLHAVGGAAVHPDGQLRGARRAGARAVPRGLRAFIGHLRGGLAHATVAACAGFGAICGSSIATAATMSKVAYPSMKSWATATRCPPA
jgi:C4-dicarboxylate transporter DctM subunit